MLHSPTALDLTASTAPLEASKAPAITHTYVSVTSDSHRLLSVLTLLRLGLVNKKTLLFVNSPDMAYRVRLLLEAFGTRAGTLVATLPLASRHRAIEQFNVSAYDVLVAAEASASAAGREAGEGKDPGEFGVTRGIDFQGVRTVVNVEAPESVSAYTHRVGRTGRAGAMGLAVTLFGPKDAELFSQLQRALPVRPQLPCSCKAEACTAGTGAQTRAIALAVAGLDSAACWLALLHKQPWCTSFVGPPTHLHWTVMPSPVRCPQAWP